MKKAAILAGIFTIGILLRICFLNVPAAEMGSDERFYLNYASYLAQDQDASIRVLFHEYLRNDGFHEYPNPLRFGYMAIASLWMKAIGRFDFQALCLLSSLFSVFGLALGYLFANKLFGKNVAILATALLAVSPIALAMARRGLQDSAVYFFVILALYLFYVALENRGVFWKIAFGIFFYVAISIKETSVLLALFFVIFMILDKDIPDRRMNIISILVTVMTVFAAVFLSYLWIGGSVKEVIGMAKVILTSPMTNEYAIKYQSGGFSRYLLDLFLVSPITLIATIYFVVIYLMRRIPHNKAATYVVTLLIVLYITYSFFSKNLRYIMALDFPIAICAALLFMNLSISSKRHRSAILACVTAVMMVLNIYVFQHMFLRYNVYDPVTDELVYCWKHLKG